jgi:predicted phosphodiesterase
MRRDRPAPDPVLVETTADGHDLGGPADVSDRPEVTTVTDDEVVVWVGTEHRRYTGLAHDTVHHLDGIEVRTLPRPGGELVATIATVNDVHFGEAVCGHIEGLESLGPPIDQPNDEPPYPQTMNHAVIDDIEARHRELGGDGVSVVVAKGDLTADGTVEQYDEFLAAYHQRLGHRLVHVRGNHDAYHGGEFAAWPTQRVDVGGATLAVLDTTIPGKASGQVTDDQVAWLDELAAPTHGPPVLVFGHHHVWDPDSNERPDDYFGVHPDRSDLLVGLFARRSRLAGWFAGHTHRNRVRRFAATGLVPWVEVACTKDFPGAWAEYRIYEGGVVQAMRRATSESAVAWAERTRTLFGGLYPRYAFGGLADRCFTVVTNRP